MRRYDLVQGSTQIKLVEAMNDFLEYHPGWTPQGGFQVVADTLGTYYVQAVYLYKPGEANEA
jgi:hypothetical protein